MNPIGRQNFLAGALMAKEKLRYFSDGINRLIPVETNEVPTLATSEDWILYWNSETLAKWPVEWVAFAWIHELSHCLRRHAKRCRDGAHDPKLFNIAGDCEINDDMPPVFTNLPDWIWTPSKIECKDGELAEVYYEKLKDKATKTGGSSGKGKPQPGGKDKGKGGSGADAQQAEPGEGEGAGEQQRGAGGWCGGAAGRKAPGEPAAGTEAADQPKGLSEQEQAQARRQVANAIKKQIEGAGRGSVPGGWQEWANAQFAPPKVRWQEKLARATRHALAYRTGMVDATYRKINRRQYGIGFGSGKPVMAAHHAPIPNVAVIADTSGSMGQKELKHVLDESKGIIEATGGQITFCANDAAVHELRTVRHYGELLTLLKGRGGTDFRPAFTALETRKPRPDVIVFITDGDGPAPKAAPAWAKVIWVLVGAHQRSPCTWGEQIAVRD